MIEKILMAPLSAGARVKRMLLADWHRLAVFFGRARTFLVTMLQLHFVICSSGRVVCREVQLYTARLISGNTGTNDFLLPLLITVLNDRDWLLRAAFFENVVDLAVFLGRVSLQVILLSVAVVVMRAHSALVVGWYT